MNVNKNSRRLLERDLNLGLFHCPVGAAYHDDDECIDCGLCYAQTPEEKIAASKKIREYIRSHTRVSTRPARIAICGKGGSGKTTVVTLLATALKGNGCKVIVLDADESNPGLGRLLGVSHEPHVLQELFRESPAATANPRLSLLERERFTVSDIPSGFVTGDEGLRFMQIGKITDPFQGCACSLAELARQVVEKLSIGEDEILLIDMEAGVESFGRGVERHADTILAVVEPSYESIVLAGRIVFMAEGMGITNAGTILNKVSGPGAAERMTEELGRRDVKIFGIIHHDRELADAGFEGKPLRSSAALDEVRAIAQLLISTRDKPSLQGK